MRVVGRGSLISIVLFVLNGEEVATMPRLHAASGSRRLTHVQMQQRIMASECAPLSHPPARVLRKPSLCLVRSRVAV